MTDNTHSFEANAFVLQTIQQRQFSDRADAEAMLLQFLRESLHLPAARVELRPLAVSLNSFNGFLTMEDGRRLFFKTHTESDTVIQEYYQAEMLAEAGYPVIQPIYRSAEVGKQLLIYEVIEHPSVFDVAWQLEANHLPVPDALAQAQHAADDQLFQLYQRTLQLSTPQQAVENAPIHQLFLHRLVGGRLDRFYGADVQIELPTLGRVTMADVRRAHWQINGQHYDVSLDDLIERAARLLAPAAGATIIGHGDAHNGNVFLVQNEAEAPHLLYFDPAFAGRHSPLLDLVKPLFHNVFAMWMYYPHEKAASTQVELTQQNGVYIVQHDYTLHSVRDLFLTSKVERVLIPVLRELKAKNALPNDWRSFMKAALFCCPFLTMNLADPAKFPPAISLLGLAMSVEMGAEANTGESSTQSRIDQVLDAVARAL